MRIADIKEEILGISPAMNGDALEGCQLTNYAVTNQAKSIQGISNHLATRGTTPSKKLPFAHIRHLASVAFAFLSCTALSPAIVACEAHAETGALHRNEKSGGLVRSSRVSDISLRGRRKLPQCRDRRDNDGDGRTDFPLDRGCRSKNDRSEFNKPKPKATPSPIPNGVPTTPPTTDPNSGRPDPATISLGNGGDLGGARSFPADNPWNTDISGEAVDPNSATLISSIGLTTGLHPDFGTVYEGAPIGIPYVVVGGDQPKENVSFYYPDESDAGPYPIPSNPPIEGGDNASGDRHIIMIDRDAWKLYELFDARLVNGRWNAGSGAIFDLSSNAVRPAGWTSADAAGLPIFPGLVRYDEVITRGIIEHALRFTVQRSRQAYIYPARHYASSNTSASLPPMGMRVRLKADFDISRFQAPVRVILTALKKYGMFVADNGSNWFISGAPDPRWDDDILGTIRQVQGKDFEVVKMGTIVTASK